MTSNQTQQLFISLGELDEYYQKLDSYHSETEHTTMDSRLAFSMRKRDILAIVNQARAAVTLAQAVRDLTDEYENADVYYLSDAILAAQESEQGAQKPEGGE